MTPTFSTKDSLLIDFTKWKHETCKISDMRPYENNPRKITKDGIAQLKKSLENIGYVDDIALFKDGRIAGGHARYYVCKADKIESVPVKRCAIDLTPEQEREVVVRLNKNIAGEWDFDILSNSFEIDELLEQGFLPNELNINDDAAEINENGTLADRFVVPPFTILDSRQGYWLDRKAFWCGKIKDFGESREGTLSKGDNLITTINKGVSILDPVLAEILVKWFSNPGHTILDCFAGDTIFGYVSGAFDRQFIGIELREEQARLNNERVDGLSAKYVCDDGQNVLKHVKEESVDMFFSCPPYFDLEVYSDLDNDASNQGDYAEFIQILDNAFSASCKALKNNSFACVVVGDVRDKKTGHYYDFLSDIKAIFKRNGLGLYNEMVLVNSVGTARLRAAKFFNGSRKICKVHQNVFVFYKGDTKNIKDDFNELIKDTDIPNEET